MRDIIRYNNSRGMMVHSPTNRGKWVLWKDVAPYIKESRPTVSDYMTAIKVYREYSKYAPMTASMRGYEKYCNDCLNSAKAPNCI